MTSKISRRIRAALSPSPAMPEFRVGANPLAEGPGKAPRRGRMEQIRRELARLERRHQPTASVAPLAPRPAQAASSPPAHLAPYHARPQRLQYRHSFPPGDYLELPLPRPDHLLLEQIQHTLTLAGCWTEGAAPLRAEELMFFDIETTGLSRSAGTLAFAIGVGFFSAAGEMIVDQIFLTDPGREAEALERLSRHLSRARVLVSFNGRSFDLPVLRNRGLLNRQRLRLDLPHLDLLHLCRRLFRDRLPDCRLSTIEREILGFRRQGDPSGAEAPRMYHDYLASGRWDELPLLLHHNLLDVLTLSALLGSLSRRLSDPLRWAEDAEELLATGLLHLRQGCWAQGERCLGRGLELAQAPCTRQRLLCGLARHLRRIGRREEAANLWDEFRQEFPQRSTGWVELAKYHEHVTKDLSRALALTEEAPGPHLDQHQRRLNRLRRRLDRELSA